MNDLLDDLIRELQNEISGDFPDADASKLIAEYCNSALKDKLEGALRKSLAHRSISDLKQIRDKILSYNRPHFDFKEDKIVADVEVKHEPKEEESGNTGTRGIRGKGKRSS